jgi:thiol-disulfide isomerase/thioredoxin
LFLCSCRELSQKPAEQSFLICLENTPFDSLFLYEYTDDAIAFFKGEKVKADSWKFMIPDSSTETRCFRLTPQLCDSGINIAYQVRFYGEVKGKKYYFNGIDSDDRFIYARYDAQNVLKDQLLLIYKNGEEEVITTDIVTFDFQILNNDGSDIFIKSLQPYFSGFTDPYDENRSYDDFMEEYVALSEKYPDSKYLLEYLSSNLWAYRSKEDIVKIYHNLSDKYKETDSGKYIERFLAAQFENMDLRTLDQKHYEAILTDSTKLNYIAFTASWCQPCREEIPLLKQVYQDLKDKLILTYVSIDEEKTIKNFQKLMQDENIPWRALFSYEESLSIISKKYFIPNGIPHGILVYPDGKVEIMDIRDDEQRQKLYSLCGNDY